MSKVAVASRKMVHVRRASVCEVRKLNFYDHVLDLCIGLIAIDPHFSDFHSFRIEALKERREADKDDQRHHNSTPTICLYGCQQLWKQV